MLPTDPSRDKNFNVVRKGREREQIYVRNTNPLGRTAKMVWILSWCAGLTHAQPDGMNRH